MYVLCMLYDFKFFFDELKKGNHWLFSMTLLVLLLGATAFESVKTLQICVRVDQSVPILLSKLTQSTEINLDLDLKWCVELTVLL